MWETEYDQADSYERIFESDSLRLTILIEEKH